MIPIHFESRKEMMLKAEKCFDYCLKLSKKVNKLKIYRLLGNVSNDIINCLVEEMECKLSCRASYINI